MSEEDLSTTGLGERRRRREAERAVALAAGRAERALTRRELRARDEAIASGALQLGSEGPVPTPAPGHGVPAAFAAVDAAPVQAAAAPAEGTSAEAADDETAGDSETRLSEARLAESEPEQAPEPAPEPAAAAQAAPDGAEPAPDGAEPAP
ncbi:MAG: hypothetical protein JJE50_11090, partial [Actinomycetales bacterium]|nr:hypothetical protein [Actinomycetales bacterium]